jgi:hypothetical protein
VKSPPKHEFKVGDHAEITAKGLVATPKSKPAQLIKIGWPNEFLVSDIIEGEDGQILLCLDPCCGWMRKSDRSDEEACKGHPSEFFRALEENVFGEGAEPREGAKKAPEGEPVVSEAKAGEEGRFTAFDIDGEEVFSVEFGDGEKDRKHRATVKLPGGKTLGLIGREAKLLNDLILTKLNLG